MSERQRLINESHRMERESAEAARKIRCPWPGCTKDRRRYSYDDSVGMGYGGRAGRFAYCQEHLNKSMDQFWNEQTNSIIRSAQ